MNNDIAILAVWLRACEKLRHLAGQGGMRDFILKNPPLPPALEKHKNDLADLVDGQGEGAAILLGASEIVNRMHPSADDQPRMESIFTRVRLGAKKFLPQLPNSIILSRPLLMRMPFFRAPRRPEVWPPCAIPFCEN